MSLNEYVRIYGFHDGCVFFLAWQGRDDVAWSTTPRDAVVPMVAVVRRRLYGKGPIYGPERRAMMRPETVVHGR